MLGTRALVTASAALAAMAVLALSAGCGDPGVPAAVAELTSRVKSLESEARADRAELRSVRSELAAARARLAAAESELASLKPRLASLESGVGRLLEFAAILTRPPDGAPGEGPYLSKGQLSDVLALATVRVSARIGNDRQQGSGFFIRRAASGEAPSRWYVITAAHVVGNHRRGVDVTVEWGGIRVGNVARVGVDPRADVALLDLEPSRFDAIAGDAVLRGVSFWDGAGAVTGREVIVVGYPEPPANTRTGAHTVTDGLVTNGGVIAACGSRHLDHGIPFLQTNADINPGSSGSPVMAVARAEVIGMATCGDAAEDSRGVNFFLGLNEVWSRWEELTGQVDK